MFFINIKENDKNSLLFLVLRFKINLAQRNYSKFHNILKPIFTLSNSKLF